MQIAATPEDFLVEEIPLYSPSGEGEHTFVRVQKRGLTTERVVEVLARLAGVRPREIGYAGRKDRVAVASQWLSVPGLAPSRALELQREELRVLEAARHPHKLRTGQLRGNRFELVVRELTPSQVSGVDERLAALVRHGLPNRFGHQRFGRSRDNAERARRLLASGEAGADRRQGRFLLSALQAEVFNAFLCQRGRSLPLDGLEAGEVAWIHASGAAFVVEDAGAERERADRFEISATGPIFGTRMLWPRDAALARERALLEEHEISIEPPMRLPRGIRLRGARRPVRIQPSAASARVEGTSAVRLQFGLPPGSYATVLAEELFG